jgi:hypothetical protein
MRSTGRVASAVCTVTEKRAAPLSAVHPASWASRFIKSTIFRRSRNQNLQQIADWFLCVCLSVYQQVTTREPLNGFLLILVLDIFIKIRQHVPILIKIRQQ